MTNYSFFERIDQAHSAQVTQLFWIAAQWQNSELLDILCEMDDKEFEACFPEIYKTMYYHEYREDQELMMEAITEFRQFGFFARVAYPEHTNFRFDENGNFKSCSIQMGISRIRYIYAETIEELMLKIEAQAEEVFQKYLLKDKKKQLAKINN